MVNLVVRCVVVGDGAVGMHIAYYGLEFNWLTLIIHFKGKTCLLISYTTKLVYLAFYM